jgi:hypothetical protein
LTITPLPRNLLMDLAFFGLSTITRSRIRPDLLPLSSTDSLGRAFFAAIVLVDVFFAAALRLGAAFAVSELFRATVNQPSIGIRHERL